MESNDHEENPLYQTKRKINTMQFSRGTSSPSPSLKRARALPDHLTTDGGSPNPNKIKIARHQEPTTVTSADEVDTSLSFPSMSLPAVRFNNRVQQIYNKLNYVTNMSQMLDSYIDIFSHGFPMFDRETIRQLIQLVSQLNDTIAAIQEYSTELSIDNTLQENLHITSSDLLQQQQTNLIRQKQQLREQRLWSREDVEKLGHFNHKHYSSKNFFTDASNDQEVSNGSIKGSKRSKKKKTCSGTKILLYLCIQAFTLQRLGHSVIARRTFEQCKRLFRDYLNKQTVRSLKFSNEDKVYLICALALASYYLTGEGGEERRIVVYKEAIEYYLHLVKKEDLDASQKMKLAVVHKCLALVDLCLKGKFSDYRDGVRALQVLIRGIEPRGHPNREEQPIERLKAFMSLPDDLGDIIAVSRYVDYAENLLHGYWRRNNQQTHVSEVLFHFYYRLISNGIRLQLMFATPDISIEKLSTFADIITEDVSKHIMLFTYCPAPIQYVAFASRIHLMHVSQFNNGHSVDRDIQEATPEVVTRLLKNIQLDYYHLATAATKFSMIEKEHSDVIRDLLSCIQAHTIDGSKRPTSVGLTDEEKNELALARQQKENAIQDKEKHMSSIIYSAVVPQEERAIEQVQLIRDGQQTPEILFKDNLDCDASPNDQTKTVRTEAGDSNVVLWDSFDEQLLHDLLADGELLDVD